MSKIALCTDSSALLPVGTASLLGVTVVPIPLTLNGDPVAVQDEAIDGFYAQLAAGASVTTSQPSPGQLLDAYASAAAGGATEVLSIHLDARVSGTVASAELAAREAPVPVTVVDTGTASFGVGVCVRAAAETVAAGGSASAAATDARELGSKLRNVFVAAGDAGGRVGDVSGWALLELVDGKTQPLVACSGLADAVELMATLIGSTLTFVRAAVGHAGAATEPAADALAVVLARSTRVVEVERYRVGPAVGAHTGPLSFGAFWWPVSE